MHLKGPEHKLYLGAFKMYFIQRGRGSIFVDIARGSGTIYLADNTFIAL